MGQVGVGVVKLVDALGEGQHALLGVGGLERGQLDAAHQEALHLGRVVLVNLLGDELFHLFFHRVVVDVEVVFVECLFVFAFLRGLAVVAVAVFVVY